MSSLLQAGLALLLSVGLAACCCGGKSSPSSNTGTGTTTPATAKRATIAAPNNPDGSPRRGIVRSAADFKATEVTRLNNGTQITILAELHGGWLQIEWDGGSGYIHHDVVRR